MNERWTQSIETKHPVMPSLEAFLKDEVALEMAWQLSQSEERGQIPEELAEHFCGIFESFQPLARAAVWSRIRRFSRIDPEEINDILAEQDLRLWQVVHNFHWWNYGGKPEHGQNAFISYLTKMNSSFFANTVIQTQGWLGEAAADFNGFNRQRVQRPIEDQLISKEDREVLAEILAEWFAGIGAEASELKALYIDGRTREELAAQAGVKPPAITKRLSKQKSDLYHYLKQQGVDVMELLITGDFLPEGMTREEILSWREGFIRTRLPRMNGLVPPKTREAIECFYGIKDGYEVVKHDFHAVAEKMGWPEPRLRKLVSDGTQILLGKKLPTGTSQERQRQLQLYQNWQRLDRAQAGLNPLQEAVLDQNFGEGKSLATIAKELSVSASTIERWRERALSSIQQVINWAHY
jgi:DNA-directed RNA polymerase specialized sigma24 family protein